MRIVDLSIPLSDDVPADPPYMKPAIEYSFSRTGRSRASISEMASSITSQRSRKSVLRISSLESK